MFVTFTSLKPRLDPDVKLREKRFYFYTTNCMYLLFLVMDITRNHLPQYTLLDV